MGNKLDVLKRVTKKHCNFCQGEQSNCKICNGTGIFEDYSYIMVVGKYAYLVDTLK